MSNPEISVIMPVFNGERFLADSIESILRQSYQDFEFIIINDGSTDGTLNILHSVSDPRVKVIHNEINRGTIFSLNAGLRIATGKYIARQDADDLSLPDRLIKQMRFINEHPEIVLLGSSANIIDETGKKVDKIICWHQSSSAVRWALIFGNAFVHTSVLFDREIVWDQNGGYSHDAKYFEDYELFTRIAANHPVAIMDDTLVSFRVHTFSTTQQSNYLDFKISQSRVKVLSNYISKLLPTFSLADDEIQTLVSYLGTRAGKKDKSKNLSSYYSILTRLARHYLKIHPKDHNLEDLRIFISRQYGQLSYYLFSEQMWGMTIRAATRSILFSPSSFFRQVRERVLKRIS